MSYSSRCVNFRNYHLCESLTDDSVNCDDLLLYSNHIYFTTASTSTATPYRQTRTDTQLHRAIELLHCAIEYAYASIEFYSYILALSLPQRFSPSLVNRSKSFGCWLNTKFFIFVVDVLFGGRSTNLHASSISN